MKLLTCPVDTEYAGEEVLPAGQRYVVPTWATQWCARALRDAGGLHPRISTVAHLTRPYYGQDLSGKSLLSWRGLGVGDQLIWAGLLQILAGRYPDAEIVLAVYPKMLDLLWRDVPGMPFRVRSDHVPLEQWCSYDWHLVGEDLVEANQEPDQPDIWTTHLLFAGIDPDTVPEDERLPLVPTTWSDDVAAGRWRSVYAGGRPLVLWQLRASSPVRSYRPALTREALELLRSEIPEAVVAVTGDPAAYEEYGPLPDGVITTRGLSLRQVFSLVCMADCVVCPDSCLGHVAGAFGTPCVSLWSSFRPADRVGSYTSHHPLVGFAKCAPCRYHEQGAVARGCPRCQDDASVSPWCEGLAAISPRTIVHTVQEIL